MDNTSNYIYFEIKYIKGVGGTEPTIENENMLLFKPDTNSSGVWGFSNMTERKVSNGSSYSIVDQYWVDLDKFNISDRNSYKELREQVSKVLYKFADKLGSYK